MKKKLTHKELPEPLAGSFTERIDIDRMGSYTGIVETPWEVPIQDADDL